MNVTEACARRRSIRAFRPDPVPAELVREIVELAHLGSPSGGNLQPWTVHALSGEPLAALKAGVRGKPPEPAQYEVYPQPLFEPYRTRRFRSGENLYGLLGIPREDKPARLRQFARNGDLFGAPVGLFFCVDRQLGSPQWADVGMFMQSVMLLAVERGLDTCPQEYWSLYPETLGRLLGLESSTLLFAGMAMGYRDLADPINDLRPDRVPLEEMLTMHGFD